MACSRQTSISSGTDELEILKSIYLDEIEELSTTEKSCRSLLFTVKPTVDEDCRSNQYLSLQLEITIPADYPLLTAEVKVKNPRGLTDDELNFLNSQIASYLHQNKGQPVLFDIIQLAQEFLSSSDVPKLPCSICLNGFHSEDNITVTKQCHHHYHSVCLGRYVEHVLEEKDFERSSLPPLLRDSVTNEVGCPLCRCSMDYDLTALLAADPPKCLSDVDSFDWTELANPIEKCFKDLYEKQKEKGGLIDVDEEQKRLLVTEDTKVLLTPSTSSAAVNLLDSSEPKKVTESDAPPRLGLNVEDNHNKPKQNAKGNLFAPKYFNHRGRGGRYYDRGGYYNDRKYNRSHPRNEQESLPHTKGLKVDESDTTKCNNSKLSKSMPVERDTTKCNENNDLKPFSAELKIEKL